MTRATQIRSNCLADSNRDSKVRQDEIQQFLAKKARQDYERNVSQIHTHQQQQEQHEQEKTHVRKRTSILKQHSINGLQTPTNKKKQVHWPETLPRYTQEKRWRNIRRVCTYLLNFKKYLKYFLQVHLPDRLVPSDRFPIATHDTSVDVGLSNAN